MALPDQLYDDLTKDLITASILDAELFGLKYSRIEYLVCISSSEDLNIYSEPKDRKQDFEVAKLIPMRLQLNPTEDDLSKFGIEEKRDALIVLSKYLLDSEFSGLIPKIGDRINFNSEQFEIKDVKTTDYWRDSNNPMRYVCAASKVTKVPQS